MAELFEHTADIGIRARAGSLNGLFADAARGLFTVMVANLDIVQPVEETSFRIPGENYEELLHDWLAELLYTFYAKRLVLAEYRINVGSTGLSATAWGETINPSRHQIDAEIKAVTWCALKVEQIGDQWQAEVVVDV